MSFFHHFLFLATCWASHLLASLSLHTELVPPRHFWSSWFSFTWRSQHNLWYAICLHHLFQWWSCHKAFSGIHFGIPQSFSYQLWFPATIQKHSATLGWTWRCSYIDGPLFLGFDFQMSWSGDFVKQFCLMNITCFYFLPCQVHVKSVPPPPCFKVFNQKVKYDGF